MKLDIKTYDMNTEPRPSVEIISVLQMACFFNKIGNKLPSSNGWAESLRRAVKVCTAFKHLFHIPYYKSFNNYVLHRKFRTNSEPYQEFQTISVSLHL